MNKTKFALLCSFVFAAFVLMSFISPQNAEKKPWEIPDKYKSMENPHKGDKELLRVGKMMYAKHCKSCHGNKGLGDGPRAKQLETSMDDLSGADFQKYSDGAVYYMSIIGRDEMPNFEKEIPDEEDRWAVVNYIRKLAK